MSGIVQTQLSRLAGQFAELKRRVRYAVAGELARAVSEAVGQVIRVIAAGRPESPHFHRWASEDRWSMPRDPWEEPDPNDFYDSDDDPRTTVIRGETSALPAAVTVGLLTARWWLARRKSLLTAACVGLGIGLLGLLGGPLARTAVAALAAAADVLGSADFLGAAQLLTG